MAQFSALEGMAIYDVVNLFINAVEFVNGLLQLNVQAESWHFVVILSTKHTRYNILETGSAYE